MTDFRCHAGKDEAGCVFRALEGCGLMLLVKQRREEISAKVA